MIAESVTELMKEIDAFETRQNFYFIGLIGLFLIAIVMTLALLYWPFDRKDEDDE